MQSRVLSKYFPIFVTIAVLFIWFSSLSMPGTVASHFGPTGKADGFMPREVYMWFMVALVALLPAFVVYMPNRLMTKTSDKINLPNREYWLTPERRQQTLKYLCETSFRFGYLLIGFLAYMHWLVVRANESVPPVLGAEWFIGGLVVFVLATCTSVFALFRRFGRVPH